MRVGIIRLNTSDFGKIGSYNVQEIGLAKGLMQHGFEARVFYLYEKVKEITVDKRYNYVYYLPSFSLVSHGIFNVKLLDLFGLDAIIMFADNQIWQKPVIDWCAKRKKRCICYFGASISAIKDVPHIAYSKLLFLHNRKCYEYSHNTAKTSCVFKEMQQLHVNMEAVVPIGLDETDLVTYDYTQQYKDKNYTEKPVKTLLFVGRLSPNKHPLMAVELFEKIAQNIKELCLVMIGNGVLERELENKIKNSKYVNRISWHKRVDYHDMWKFYRKADCVINLCEDEIFGMVMLEAMYYGVPVVAEDAAGPKDFIIDDETGFIIKGFDYDEWISNIELALNDDGRIAKAAQKLVVENYLWNKASMKFIEILNKRD